MTDVLDGPGMWKPPMWSDTDEGRALRHAYVRDFMARKSPAYVRLRAEAKLYEVKAKLEE